jgi:hypothetical protein
MRHKNFRMTAWYTKAIPEQVRVAVESMDAEIWGDTRTEKVN